MNCKNCLKADVCKFSESFMAESNELTNLLKEKSKNSPVKPITELKYDCSLFVDANPTPVVADVKPVVKRKRRTKAEIEAEKNPTKEAEPKKAEKKDEHKEEVKAESEKTADEIVEENFMNFDEKAIEKKDEPKAEKKVDSKNKEEVMKLNIESSHYGNFTDEQIAKIKSTGAKTFADLKAVKDELDPEIIKIYNEKLATSFNLDPL